MKKVLILALVAFVALLLQAQTADSPAVKEHIEKARVIAGTLWAPDWQFFCIDPHANAATDPPIEPSKIFDNVYAIGNTGTVAYAITTSDGIMLLDALAANETEPVLLPGMRKLGLDPANVKLVVVAHGHADHFGGSAYFQERGAKVAMSAEDWDFIAPKPGAAGTGANRGPAPPHRDIALLEGQPVRLGDVSVTPVLTPGHTPGSMGFFFPVKDGGRTYTAALFGGTMLTATRPTPEQLNQYLASIAHFRAEAVKADAEAELQNHPLMDDFTGRLAALKTRKSGQPNPFIVGRDNYPKFLDVMSECMQAQIARRKL
ncbi:MAG TPA: MBL fold metallo-hydrolase [Bryobacteraceae bacterium]|jgi:metallo-beta-lactamase class B|nr:MBL fold metallo-hydrolase [Bryobacteraceae bacterium]